MTFLFPGTTCFPHQCLLGVCFFEEWSSCSQSCSGIRERHSEVSWKEVVGRCLGDLGQPNLNTFEHNLGNPGVYIMYIYTYLSINNLLLYALNCEHVCHPALGTRTCLLHFHVCVCVRVCFHCKWQKRWLLCTMFRGLDRNCGKKGVGSPRRLKTPA